MADKKSRVDDQFIYNEGDPTEVYTGPKPKSVGELTVKVNVDVSEALTGLKSLTREAREATKALRELETTAQRLSTHLDANAVEYYTDIRQATQEETYDWRKVACDNITKALEEAEATKSITDDITRSYGLDGVGE